MIRFCIWISAVVFLTSCGTQRNLAYFSNLQDSTVYKSLISNNVVPTIQPNDQLSITVSSMSTESNGLFTSTPSSSPSSTNNASAIPGSSEGYLVDKEGVITMPTIGKVKLAGLTREEAIEKLTSVIGANYVKSPTIDVRFMNFKVTVIGEVNRPSTVNVTNERITVLEALGLAGDMTGFGKRENVLVIREKDGTRTVTRLNLNNKDVLNSPFFYLQQNDVVYVEPDKAKAVQVSRRTINMPFYLSIATIVAILVSRFTF